jgi:hypothetical protein
VILLAVVFSKNASQLQWRVLGRTSAVSLMASSVMGTACWYVLHTIPQGGGLRVEFARVGMPVVVSVGVYLATVAIAGREELRILWSARERD